MRMKKYRIAGSVSTAGYEYEKDQFKVTHGSQLMRVRCSLCLEAQVWKRSNATIHKKDIWMVVHRLVCK